MSGAGDQILIGFSEQVMQDLLGDVIERREEQGVLALEVMRQSSCRGVGGPGHVDKAGIVDALPADHLDGGFGKIATASVMVDLFWHNDDYKKDRGERKR